MAIARKAPLRATKAAAPIYQLRIELLDVSPVIWRRLLVPGSIKLHKLHAVLLWTMGWAGGHLHEFVIGHDHCGEPDPDFDTPPRVQREERFTLAAALGARKSFIYLYDFGDGWEHRVTVEKTLPADPALKLPQCLDGANACPPEGEHYECASSADTRSPTRPAAPRWGPRSKRQVRHHRGRQGLRQSGSGRRPFLRGTHGSQHP